MAAAPLRMLAPVAVVHPMGVQEVTPLPRHMASALRTRALVGNNGLMGLQLAPACKALVGREHPKVACIPTTAVASATCPCNAAGVSTEHVCNAYDTVLAFLRAFGPSAGCGPLADLASCLAAPALAALLFDKTLAVI